MRIYLYDILFICLGLTIGTYQLFIDDNHRISNGLSGILSYILSLWIGISCVKSVRNKQN